MRKHLATAIISLTATHSFADTVWLINGDRVSGEIQRLDETSLTIKPDYASAINLELTAIRSFATDDSKLWKIQAQPHAAKVSESTVAGYVAIDNAPVAIGELSLSIAEPTPGWRMNGHLGSTINVDTSTNKDGKELHLDAELNLESKDWRHNVKSDINYEKEKKLVTENTVELRYALDYFFDDQWLLRSESLYREDNLPPNNQYTLTGAGPGYRLWGEQRNRLDIIGTYNYLWFSEDNVKQSFGGWAITLDYMQFWFNDKLETFADVQVVFPDVDSIDPILDMDVGLRLLVTSKIYLSLKYDYREAKALQERVVDSGYAVGAGVSF